MEAPYQPPSAVLQDENMLPASVPKGVRFLSLCMIIGGVVAIAVSAALFNQYRHDSGTIVFVGLFACLYAFYIYRGVLLWRLGGRECKWAFWLFLIQVPVISLFGFHYYLYTGLIVALQFGDVASNLVLMAGGGFQFVFTEQTDITCYGVNLFALFSSIYLLRKAS